ncbi:MAG: DUF3037 domain-containing protein [Thaumarchaeota archaeon]|nr:DUF3037 domain-containing protein [Nitrososphaerota archaeon]
MSTYSYVIARFVPDIVKNEPVNVGVLVQSGDKIIEGKFIENFRSLGQRYKDVNVKALQGIIDSFRDTHQVQSHNYLTNIAKDFQYQLVFSNPKSIVAGSPKAALDELYDLVISVEPRKTTKKTLTRLDLKLLVRKEIEEKLEKQWIVRKHIIKGPKDDFAFDFAFKNGKVRDLLHAISFEGNAKLALTQAKALALTVEYVIRENNDISCTALIHPPKDDEKEKEYYEPAIGYLKDQECSIKTEQQIPQYVSAIQKKLSRAH